MAAKKEETAKTKKARKPGTVSGKRWIRKKAYTRKPGVGSHSQRY